MRVYISVDMEGIAGVVHQDHTGRQGQDYEDARLLMTNEANAAIEGALDAGATEIVVNDSHGTMRNIMPAFLRKEAKLISGTPKKLGMMEGIQKGFDAAAFVGYHTRASSQGVLNHTYNGRVIRSVTINDIGMGEFGINALIAGEYKVPTVFVSGCHLLVEESKTLVPNIYAAQVKETVNRVSTMSLHPERSCELIKSRVTEALKNYHSIEPYVLSDDTFTFDVQFLSTLSADIAEILPYITRKDPSSITFKAASVVEGFRILRSVIMMASSYSS